MAEFQHYANWKESLDLLRAVVAKHGFVVIPFPSMLTEPTVPTYSALDEAVEKILALRQDVLLEGPFSKPPLRFNSHGDHAFFLQERYGQRLRWNLSHEYLSRNSRRVISSGSLSHLSTYRHPVTEELEPASDGLKAAFKAVVATLKRRMVKVTIRKGDAVWVGTETKKEVDAGLLHIDR